MHFIHLIFQITLLFHLTHAQDDAPIDWPPRRCHRDDHGLKGYRTALKTTLVATASASNLPYVKRKISGIVQILDGCTFRVSGFYFKPPAVNAYWYGLLARNESLGGYKKPGKEGPDDMVPLENMSNGDGVSDVLTTVPRVVAAPMGSYDGHTINFPLIGGINWSMFSHLRIYAEEEKRVLGHFSVGEQPDDGYAAQTEGGATRLEIGRFWTPFTEAVFLMFAALLLVGYL